MPTSSRPITRSQPAYKPTDDRVRRPWIALVAALLIAAVIAVASRPTCRPDEAGANESALGVRHQKRGAVWFHCEPWIRRVVSR